MLDQLFPPETTRCVAENWMWETPTLPAEETNIARAVEKRKREFRAGRHCAHSALNQLFNDDSYARKPIRVGESRQPKWPDGVVGSISHSGTHCSAVVAKSNDILSLGHDVEKAKDLEPNVHKMICTEKEIAFAARHSSLDLPLTTVIFSAKESIHKTYFPLNGHMLDFLDAELEIDLGTRQFQAQILNPEANPKFRIPYLRGAFAVFDGYVYTGIYVRQNDII